MGGGGAGIRYNLSISVQEERIRGDTLIRDGVKRNRIEM